MDLPFAIRTLTDPADPIIKSLRQTTVPLIHLRLVLAHVSPIVINAIADAFPTLEYLELCDDDRHILPSSWLPEDFPGETYEFDTCGVRGEEQRHYLLLTADYVDVLFAPLARFPALRWFTFLYTMSEPDDLYTWVDLLDVLKWRDTETPNLRFIQLHHMKLVKEGSGLWIQDDEVHWVEGRNDFIGAIRTGLEPVYPAPV